jgi:DNA-binding response OmpR family regulator
VGTAVAVAIRRGVPFARQLAAEWGLEQNSPSGVLVMARDAPRRAEPREREGAGPLSASRTVLVVSSESRRAGEIVGALQGRGVPSVQASNPPQAVFWARRSAPALVLLDLDVQRAGALLGEFRSEGRLMIALGDDAGQRLRALEAGCVDALPQSLEPDELALKVVRLARSDPETRSGRVIAGPLMVDLSACRLMWRGEELTVSPLLLDLAAYLAIRRGRLTPTRTILQDVWGEPWSHPNKVHQAAYRLRRRLREPADSSFLVAKRGHGYGVFPDAVHLAPVDEVAG